MSDVEDPLIEEAIRTLSSAIELGRADIVHVVVTTAAESSVDGSDKTGALRMILDCVEPEKGTCLHQATKIGSADVVRTLLAAGADASIKDSNGKTCYDLATTEKIKNAYVGELLQAVAHEGELEHVKKLLESGINVNETDGTEKANTALHWAATYASNPEVIEFLCSHSADVNKVNGDGATALHDAAKRGVVDIIRVLLSRAARTDVKAEKGEYKGKTPLDLLPSGVTVEQLGLSRANSRDLGSVLSASKAMLQSHSSASPLESPAIALPMNNGILLPPFGPKLDEFSGDREGIPYVWPPPKRVVMNDGVTFSIPPKLVVNILASGNSTASLLDIWRRVEPWFQQIGVKMIIQCLHEAAKDASIVCRLCETLLPHKEAYKLTVTSSKVFLLGTDLAGVWFGIHSFIQLVRSCLDRGGIPGLCITDWPCFSYRGVLLDLTEGKVLQLETMYGLIDVLSAVYKFNHLQLKLSDAKSTSKDSPSTNEVFSSGELTALAEYCGKQFVHLVIHFESNPTETTPVTSAYLNAWPSFSSSEICLVGLPNVPVPIGVVRQMWISGSEDFIDDLALTKCLAVVAAKAPFSSQFVCEKLSQSGVPSVLSVDIGTSVSPFGCLGVSSSNARTAASVATATGCAGLMAVDSGCLQIRLIPITVASLASTSYFAWNSQNDPSRLKERIIDVLNRHVFLDSSKSAAAYVLTLMDLEANFKQDKASLLGKLMTSPSNVKMKDLNSENVQQFLRAVRQCQKYLAAVDMSCFQAGEVKEEMAYYYEWTNYLSKVLKVLLNYQKSHQNVPEGNVDFTQLPAASRTDLGNRLLELIDNFSSVWCLRHKDVGGFRDAAVDQLKRVAGILV
eukprot:m.110708 g.110708  ORF g.110708 m.110708 type:complete len:851 (+) comp37413_c0_seq3:2033-4585(+)